MNICIIGAGVAGINSARYANQHGFEYTIFEQTGEIGGTWIYTDQIGQDKYGLPIHTSMYKDLRTNLPKEVMVLSGFSHSEKFKDKSYLSQQEILDYIRNFAKHFNISKNIKFYHHVTNVELFENNKWKVDVKNLKTNQLDSFIFDFVMVCSGKYSKPNIPEDLKGIETFKGTVLHSHDYRTPDRFQKKNVLVLGGKRSGMDIALKLSTVTYKVFLSHCSKENLTFNFPKNIIEKPTVENISRNQVFFTDGTNEPIDIILYCTGYLYYYPFLRSCKIEIKDNYVRPLYKHLIYIEVPTMVFIGVPCLAASFMLIDLQVRYFMLMISKKFQLPSKVEMYKWLEANEKYLENDLKRFRRHFHQVEWIGGKSYFDDLTIEAGLPKSPDYIFKIYEDRTKKLGDVNYKNDVYYLIDDDHFQVIRK